MKKRVSKLGQKIGQWGYEHKKWSKQMLQMKGALDELKEALDAGKKK